MKVAVKLFAVARQLAGSEVVEVELPGNPTVADLRVGLAARFPTLDPILEHVLFAVGTEYATDTTQIAPGLEIACIPPVSGG